MVQRDVTGGPGHPQKGRLTLTRGYKKARDNQKGAGGGLVLYGKKRRKSEKRK